MPILIHVLLYLLPPPAKCMFIPARCSVLAEGGENEGNRENEAADCDSSSDSDKEIDSTVLNATTLRHAKKPRRISSAVLTESNTENDRSAV